ncbi:MAG: AAA domain-containing protein [bacterium]
MLEDSSYDHTVIELPLTTRLPYDTAALVRPFYDFYFDSWSGPGERRLTLQAAWQDKSEDRICEAMTAASMTAMTLPTPVGGPPRDDDPELAAAVARLIQRLLERKAHYQTEEDPQPRLLKAEDIGVAATHRVMVTRFKESLGDLSQAIRVDTPERWQGLERQVMVVMHPLSGKLRPSSFDLDTGRLNVMLSRHRVGCVIVGRDHIDETLQSYAPRAEQAPGREDHVGAGHSRNLEFWRSLGKMGRIVQLKKD